MQRREAFTDLFKVMNPDERCGTPSPFQQAAKTRWLVRGKVLNNILLNLEELKAYFMSVEKACGQNTRYKARMIKDMLCDPTVHWYLQCVTPVIMEFERLNAFFQATDADPQDLEAELSQHQEALRARVYAADGSPRATSSVDFGARFTKEVDAHLEKHPDGAAKVQVSMIFLGKNQNFIMENIFK